MRESFYGSCHYKSVDISNIGVLKFVFSTECVQDEGLYLKLLFLPKTGPITEEEIADWKEIYKKLEVVDHNEVIKKYKLAILRDENDFPYYENECEWMEEHQNKGTIWL